MTMATHDPTAHAAATYAYVGALVDELARAGVRHVCICPGSRSTPLAFVVAEHPEIAPWVHIDERSASFFALGLARVTGAPVGFVCTSGTAAANALPAVVEARYGRVPLLVLTADRPPELRDNGAPQAIDQAHLYGRNVKWFVDMALPEAGEAAIRYARATAARAVATAREGPSGPVHLNLPFREPLVPPPDYPRHADADAAVRRDSAGDRAYVAVLPAPRIAPPETVDALAHDLAALPRGLIVCGPQSRFDPDQPRAVARLAAALGYPILADPLSNVRCGSHDTSHVLDAYDAFLRDDRAARLTPEVVLRFGASPTSRPLQTFMQRVERQILVDPDGGWQDPSGRVDTVVYAAVTRLCADLAARLERRRAVSNPDDSWIEAWRTANSRTRRGIDTYLNRLDEPFEGKVFAELAARLPHGAILYAGNSMPVRDLDTFFPAGHRAVRFLCNRGANGIDGVVSSALGAAAAAAGPLVLVIGDLSFYHDLNGLLAATRHDLDATIVLLDNDGGGIFSFLPQAGYPAHFEQLFGTPTGLDFAHAAAMYGCGFERVETWGAFRAALDASVLSRGVQVIRLGTDRARNVELHRGVWTAVAEALWRD